MKEIRLTQGKSAIVDDEDYNYLSQWKWYYSSRGYAVRATSRKLGKQRLLSMHRIILNVPDGMLTDHINHNRLDNRRGNLRICNYSQNTMNSTVYNNNKSGKRGVNWDGYNKKWHARIGYHGKSLHLGYYDNVSDASDAYNRKAKELFGEFAYEDTV